MKPTVKCPFCHNEVTIGEKFMDAEEYICFQCKKIFQRNFIKSKEDKKESVKLKIDIQKEKKSNQKREIEIANEEKITRLEQKALFVMNNKLEDINKATNIKNKKQEETRQITKIKRAKQLESETQTKNTINTERTHRKNEAQYYRICPHCGVNVSVPENN